MAGTGNSVVWKDLGWRAILESIESAVSADVLVGVVGPHAQVKSGRGNITAAEAAAISEYGSPRAGVPQRSFIRSTFEKNHGELAHSFAEMIREAIRTPGARAERLLGVVGSWAARQIRSTVMSMVPPPNAPRTVRKKGFDHPLIETGALLRAISYVVRARHGGGEHLGEGMAELEVQGVGGTEGGSFFGGGE